jgi:hypothetical protein
LPTIKIERPATFSFSEQIKQEGQNEADHDTGCNREVEPEVIFLDGNISGQLSKPGQLGRKNQDKTNGCYDEARNDEYFSDAEKWIHGLDTNERFLEV